MQGHLKINIDLFSALCPPQLHKKLNTKLSPFNHEKKLSLAHVMSTIRYNLQHTHTDVNIVLKPEPRRDGQGLGGGGLGLGHGNADADW
jgi:hypothetical protein